MSVARLILNSFSTFSQIYFYTSAKREKNREKIHIVIDRSV